MPGAPSIRAALLLGVLIACTVILWSTGSTQAATSLSTDKPDYYSNEIVTVTGSGFSHNASYDIPVTRPDGSIAKGDGSFTPGWDSVKANNAGAFTYLCVTKGGAGGFRGNSETPVSPRHRVPYTS